MRRRQNRYGRMWEWLGQRKRLVIAVCVLLNVGLGTYGFLQVNDEVGAPVPRLLDAIYRTVQTFGLNFDMPDSNGSPAPVNWFIQVSRFIAAVFTFYAVIATLFGTFLETLSLRGQAWLNQRRHILLGFGDINRAIAAELVQRPDASGYWRWQRIGITAIDQSVTPADQRAARAAGVMLIEGDLSDPDLIRRVSLHRAEKIIVAAGDDARNIEIATAIAGQLRHDQRSALSRLTDWLVNALGLEGPSRPAPSLLAHVADLSLYNGMTESFDVPFVRGGDFRPFNMDQEAAHAFVNSAQLIRTAREQAQPRVHLVIIGLGNLGEAILIDTLMNSYAHDLRPPKVTVLDVNKEAVEARLQAAYPRLFDRSLDRMKDTGSPLYEAPPEIAFQKTDLDALDFVQDPLLAALDDGAEPPTAWAFCCGEDRVNLSAGMRLGLAMDQGARNPVPFFLRRWSSEFGEGRPENPVALSKTFGNVQHTVRVSNLLEREPDALAWLVHKAYDVTAAKPALKKALTYDPALHDISPVTLNLATVGGTENATRGALQENLLESNRRVARHMPIKLTELGLAWRGMSEGVLPAIDCGIHYNRHNPATLRAETILNEVGALDWPLRMEQQASIEHCRWCVDRAVFGWRQANPGDKRNSLRRIHNNMIPYGELKEYYPEQLALDTMGIEAALVKLAFETAAGKNKSDDRPRAFPFRARQIDVALDTTDFKIEEAVTDVLVNFSPAFLSDLAKERQPGERTKIWHRLQARIAYWLTKETATRLIIFTHTPEEMAALKGCLSKSDLILAHQLHDDYPVEFSIVRCYKRIS